MSLVSKDGVILDSDVNQNCMRFVSKVLDHALKKGYTRIVEPFSCTLDASRIATDLGYPHVEASDFRLFQCVIGCVCSDSGIEKLNIESKKSGRLTTDPVELILDVKKTQLMQECGNHYADMLYRQYVLSIEETRSSIEELLKTYQMAFIRKIASLITDVDEMLETALDDAFFDKIENDVSSVPVPQVNFDWKTIQILFLPCQIDDIDRLVEEADHSKHDYAAERSQFDETVEALRRTKKFESIKNVSAALHMMVSKALDDYPDDDMELVPLEQVFGRATMPAEQVDSFKKLIEKETEKGSIENRWEMLDVILRKFEN